MYLSRTFLLLLLSATVTCMDNNQGDDHWRPSNLRGKPTDATSKLQLIERQGDEDEGVTRDWLEVTRDWLEGTKAWSEVTTKIIYEGVWGEWNSYQGITTDDHYVCGARMRFEHPCGGCDDTAANGLKFTYCHINDWSSQMKDQLIEEGYWGHWQNLAMCPQDYYVDGGQVRYEDPCGGRCDDTALNGLMLHCRSKLDSTKTSWINVYNGVWGNWKNRVVVDDQYVKLASLRIEKPLGSPKDDTAWNGLKFLFELPPEVPEAPEVEQIVQDSNQGDNHWRPSNLRGKPTDSTLKMQLIERQGDEGVTRAWLEVTRAWLEGTKAWSEVTTKIIYEGLWGEWNGYQGITTDNYYVCGARIRFQNPRGCPGDQCLDDTAANGLKFTYCYINDWFSQMQDQLIEEGYWGTWKDLVMCPQDYYVDGGQVRFEDSLRGRGDDTALNGLKLHCRSKYDSSKTSWIHIYDGVWGFWKWPVIVDDQYVKLASLRIEKPLTSGDDTAWNGLKFLFEPPPEVPQVE